MTSDPFIVWAWVVVKVLVTLTKFGHYYVLRIFHVYKCTVNENTNKSAYWYTSHKSSIPGFEKPGIVAEICPSGFVHSSYLHSDWLTLVGTHPPSQIGKTWVLQQNFCPIMIIGWFPLLIMVSSVVWLQSTSCSKLTIWVVPSIFYGAQCCLASMCFAFKIIILGGSLYFLCFAVLFGYKVVFAKK